MSTDTAFAAIKAFIEDGDFGWPALMAADGAACPLAWDNEDFALPDPTAPDVSWGKIIVDGDIWEQQTIGADRPEENRWDETGSVTFFAMVPVNTGSTLCRRRLRQFADLCRGQDIGPIEFQSARFDPIGTTDEAGNWWAMNVTIEWIRRN